MFTMAYNPGRAGVVHFVQHALYGLKSNIDRYDNPKNFLEKLGDFGLWSLEKFPGKLWALMEEPRWITLALTAIALATVSFGFYPKQTTDLTKLAFQVIPTPSFAHLKFAAYLFSVGNILSASARAYGRFSNENLMLSWYAGRDVRQDAT